jgi:hypothetical protein
MKKRNFKKIKINNNLYLEEIDNDSYSNVFIKTGDKFHQFKVILVKQIFLNKYDVIFKCSCCDKWKHELLNINELITFLED